jgi:hypothetical protein
MRKRLLKFVFVILLCCGGLTQAVPIIIQISGNITSIGGYTQVIPGSIHAGTTFTGTYTYDSAALDSDTNPQRGKYLHNSPYGISIVVGGYEFKTSPSHIGQFKMSIYNDLPDNGVNDYYAVFSQWQNVSVPSAGFTVDSIRWQLRDSTYKALSSDALPIIAPVLTDWGYNVLDISGYGGPNDYGLSIYGTVTDVRLIPEPITGVLLAMGAFFLRRRR